MTNIIGSKGFQAHLFQYISGSKHICFKILLIFMQKIKLKRIKKYINNLFQDFI
jgi:hypothetical protein